MKKHLVILAAMVLLFAACSPREEPPEETTDSTLPPVLVVTPTPPPTPTPETPIPTQPPYEGPVNPLSGQPIDEKSVNNRPIAVVINNRKISLPQLGIAAADIIFEVPVEGAYTRMLAIFQDITDAGNIGSVRSARPCFVDIAQSFDAVFIHAGGSPAAYTQMKSQSTSRFDGVNGPGTNMYFRDSQRQRTMGYEHSMLTSSEKIGEYIGTLGYRLDHEVEYLPPFEFEAELEITGAKATAVTVKFNSSKSTSFEYNADDGLYYASQQGGKYVDGNVNTQLSFANLIIVKTTIKVVDSDGRLNIDLTSGGSGFLAVGGVYMPITWEKNDGIEPFIFRNEKGDKITLRTGKTYVAVMSTSANVEFSEVQ